MSKKRKNAGAGYGYMFHGAFKDKKDAVAKERKTAGAWVKGVYTPQGHRYVVMSPRTNPRKKKAKKQENPSELMVMAANPHERGREIVVPPGSTITIRTNPAAPAENPPEHFSVAQARARGISYHPPGLIQTPRQRRVAGMVRKASGSEGAVMQRAYKKYRAGGSGSRAAKKVFHEVYGPNPAICGHLIGGEPCTRKPGHRGPHLPQGATLRPKSRLRRGWKPNPSAAALNASFTGRDGELITIFDEPHMPGGDYAQLGELLALYVKPFAGGPVQRISFPKASLPCLVSDESARQIYFVSGDQNITPALSAFGARDRGGVHELGECRRIDYKQRKEHVPDPDLDEWRHQFGEENGIRPVLLYDAPHQRLLLEGGDYRIRTEGIVN